jgi:uncharacterized protein (DUF433 family)
MATASRVSIVYPHISKTPGVCGGKACIDGTRIRVMDIVVLHEQGMPPEQMLEHYSSRPLTLSEVHAAIAYYYDHKDEIEASFAEDERFIERLDRQWEEYVARHNGHPPDVPAPEDRHISKPVGWRPGLLVSEKRHHDGMKHNDLIEAFESLAQEDAPFAFGMRHITPRLLP